MEFFEQQRASKRNTVVLVVFFILGMLAVVGSIAGVLALGMLFLMPFVNFGYQGASFLGKHFFMVLGAGAALAGAVVLLSTWSKTRSLRQGGGQAVAEQLGGALVPPRTVDPLQRRLVNVVEEMAIASGLPVPLVFFLEKEEGINAFAAGFHTSSAAVGVTKGTLELLNRDELQGVVGHEFSHILNGDMRINMRLMGLVFGIMLFGLAGVTLFRISAPRSTGFFFRRKAFAPGLALGAFLCLVGYGGAFFGNLIKAAVCRQREYLADAAAVQYTRNPDGISGALKKIGGYSEGSLIWSPQAHQVNHMFFNRGVTTLLDRLLAMHPPLEKRILRLDPLWQQEYAEITQATRDKVASQAVAEMGGLSAGFAGPGQASPDQPPGAMHQAYLAHARELIASIPRKVRDGARQPALAKAVILALLIQHDPKQTRDLSDLLLELTDLPCHDECLDMLESLRGLDPRARLPLIDLCIPALREMSREEYDAFMRAMQGLIAGDKRIDLMEWALMRVVDRHLSPHFEPEATAMPEETLDFSQAPEECVQVLSLVAHMGRTGQEAAEQAFSLGMKEMAIAAPCLSKQEAMHSIGAVLDTLAGLTPEHKRTLLTACAKIISADGEVTVNQGEFLRVIADSLGCPMPPLLPGQPLVEIMG